MPSVIINTYLKESHYMQYLKDKKGYNDLVRTVLKDCLDKAISQNE